MIRAMLFDFDGVIANTFPYHFAAWKQVFNGYVNPLWIKRLEGAPAFRIAEEIARQRGRSITEQEAKALAVRKNTLFRQAPGPQLDAEIPDLVEHAASMGLVLGLVTGTILENIQHVVATELLSSFACKITETDTVRGKPFADPYLRAAEKLDLDPGSCLVIENAPLGIQSAKAAGSWCVALETTLDAEALTAADWILKNHTMLLDQLAQLLSHAGAKDHA